MAENIKFSDWENMDLRVGKILSVENHPNADKLYILEIDLGSEKRKLVAGLKQHYTPKKLVGKLCVVFCNLEAATIRGVESKGMILAAVNSDRSKVLVLKPEKEIELGSRIS